MDSAIFLSQYEAGVGFVVRDGQGLVMAPLSKNIKQPLCLLDIKAKVLKEFSLLGILVYKSLC